MTAMPYTPASTEMGADARGTDRSWLRRVFDRLVNAQERRARRLTRHHLAGLSNSHLAQLGFNAHQIKELRTGRLAIPSSV